jgi:hypothetical protein
LRPDQLRLAGRADILRGQRLPDHPIARKPVAGHRIRAHAHLLWPPSPPDPAASLSLPAAASGAFAFLAQRQLVAGRLAAVTFTYNFYNLTGSFWNTPFLSYLWSPAVEEQFYLVLPLLMVLLRRHATPVLVVLCLVMPVVRLLFTKLAGNDGFGRQVLPDGASPLVPAATPAMSRASRKSLPLRSAPCCSSISAKCRASTRLGRSGRCCSS